MEANTDNPTQPPVSDRELIRRLTEENHQKSLETDYLKERIDLLIANLNGRKSEKRPFELEGQISFMDDLPEDPADTTPTEVEEIFIPAHKRKKKSRKQVHLNGCVLFPIWLHC